MEYKIALLGFGNVLKAFAALLDQKRAHLEARYGYKLTVVGISTNSHGLAINPDGIDLQKALALVKNKESLDALHVGESITDAFDFVRKVPADVILEATWLNPEDGQPATDLVKIALENGKHVVTANKGPVAFAYRALRDLAAKNDLGFFFESTVMDGAPVHSVGREALLGLEVNRITGILNSTTNSILTRLEEGVAFDVALKEMQDLGLAEADPTNDVDGWDAAVKINVLANVIMGADLRPNDVDREGIRNITVEDAQAALKEGKRIKLLCEAVRDGDSVKTTVRPTKLAADDPLGTVSHTACAVSFETDVLPKVTVVEGRSSPTTTAYGMLVDTLNIIRGRR